MATRFNLSDHEKFMRAHGDKIEWFKGYPCPCAQATDSNRPTLTCAACNGAGTVYQAKQVITGLITGISRERDLLLAGIAQPGDMLLGLSPYQSDMVTDWDLFKLTYRHGQPFQGQLVERSADGVTDNLAYAVKKILKVFSIDPNTGVETAYVEGTDFTVSENVITWLGVNDPVPETTYSMNYMAIFDWIAFVPPTDRFEGNVNLGQKVLLRPRHIAIKQLGD